MQQVILHNALITIFAITTTFYLLLKWPSLTTLHRGNSVHQAHLRLNAQNEFHISIFSDLHYAEEEHDWGIDQDIKSTRVMNRILDRESSDLVIISMSQPHFNQSMR